MAKLKYKMIHVCVSSDTSMTSYITIKLPKNLVEQIDKVLEEQNLGYTSRAELVKEAVRNFLANIQQNKS